MKKLVNASEPKSLIDHFSSIPDPRIDRTKYYSLSDIIFTAICAVICGCEAWDEIALFTKKRIKWFKKFIRLPNGVPSHDTYNRVFSMIDPNAFIKSFMSWVDSVCQLTDGELVAIDGKTLRGSIDRKNDKKPIHIVNAWASEANLVLGSVKTEEKSNEITAIPKLLELLDVKGCLVSIDAMWCQTDIAKQIVDQKADYLLAVKENQSSLYQSIKGHFDQGVINGKLLFDKMDFFEEEDPSHGRDVHRKCYTSEMIDSIDSREKWEKLTTIVMIKTERLQNGRHSNETRFYICSKRLDAKSMATAIRRHWSVENELHWSLDVSFREDASRKRKDHAAENFGVINRMTLSMLKRETSKRRSIRLKRMEALMNEEYLETILKIPFASE